MAQKSHFVRPPMAFLQFCEVAGLLRDQAGFLYVRTLRYMQRTGKKTLLVSSDDGFRKYLAETELYAVRGLLPQYTIIHHTPTDDLAISCVGEEVPQKFAAYARSRGLLNGGVVQAFQQAWFHALSVYDHAQTEMSIPVHLEVQQEHGTLCVSFALILAKSQGGDVPEFRNITW